MYFFIQATKTTPYALLNKGYMKISGNAVPTEETQFFGKFNQQLNKYKKKPANSTNVDINLSHVNASSKKSMVKFLKQLEVMKSQGFEVEVNWIYSTDNEDVKELGMIFKTMFNIKINLILE